ncbi:MAG: nuclear transport factor 2 family protein [Flammeovirgaceae bacterium]
MENDLLNINDPITQQLMALNEAIFKEHVLNHQTDALHLHATDDYCLINPIGKLQTKKEVVDEVSTLQVIALEVLTTQVIEKAQLRILIGTLKLTGTMNGNALPPEIRYMSVFGLEEGTWKLQSRALTPVLQI